MAKPKVYMVCQPLFIERALTMQFEKETEVLRYPRSLGRYDGFVCIEFELDAGFTLPDYRWFGVPPGVLNRSARRVLTDQEFMDICFYGRYGYQTLLTKSLSDKPDVEPNDE